MERGKFIITNDGSRVKISENGVRACSVDLEANGAEQAYEELRKAVQKFINFANGVTPF